MIFLNAWLVRESVLYIRLHNVSMVWLYFLYLSVIGIIVGEMLVVVVLVPGYTLAID